MNKLMKKKKKGFTLIELIAVIAILAVLAVVAVPRVITYVDKSKKVAIQTEATTIYNAAEAAYNDGKFEVGNSGVRFKSEHFEGFDVIALVGVLEKEGLLSNVNMDKFENFHHERGDKKPIITLRDLKTIMNAKTDDINVDSQGVLQKVPETKSTTAQQQFNNRSTTAKQQQEQQQQQQ